MVHLMSPARPISNEPIKKRLVILIDYNTDKSNKNLTATTAINKLVQPTICSYTGCNEHADSSITLRAGTRNFTFKVCKNCKKKLDD